MGPPTKETVLDLKVRRRIAECVQENPGLHMRGIAERLGIAVSTLEYHLYQLVKTGHLVTRDTAGFKAFYPSEGMDRRDRDILYLVRQEGPRRICAHLILEPGSTPKDLKQALGVSGATLSFHLKKLKEASLLDEKPAGRTKELSLQDAERVANVLVTYRKSFLDDAVDRFAKAWLDLRPPSKGEGKGGADDAAEKGKAGGAAKGSRRSEVADDPNGQGDAGGHGGPDAGGKGPSGRPVEPPDRHRVPRKKG